MLAGIPITWLVQGGAVSVLTLFLIAMLRGSLVPRRVVLDLQKDRDDRVAEANRREEQARDRETQWLQAYLKMVDAANELMRQNGELLEAAHTGAAVMEALPRSPVRKRPVT